MSEAFPNYLKDNNLEKRCSICKEWKPITEFHKKKSGKYGVHSRCKKCAKKQRKEHYEENKERIKKQTKIYHQEHKEERNKHSREYYNENKEKISNQRKEYRQKNKEKVSKRQKEYRKKTKNEAIAIYGGKCQNKECPFPDINTDNNYLEFHHLEGQSEVKIREWGEQTYYRIKKNGIQDNIELLCAPCHKRADIRDRTYMRRKEAIEKNKEDN